MQYVWSSSAAPAAVMLTMLRVKESSQHNAPTLSTSYALPPTSSMAISPALSAVHNGLSCHVIWRFHHCCTTSRIQSFKSLMTTLHHPVLTEGPPYVLPATTMMTRLSLTLWLSMWTHVFALPLSQLRWQHIIISSGIIPVDICCHYNSTANTAVPPCFHHHR